MASILLVDDDPRLLRLLEPILRLKGHQIWTANAAGAAKLGAQYSFHLVITNAAAVLSWFRRHSPETHALSGIRRPLPNAADLQLMVRRALDHRELKSLREEAQRPHAFEALIVEDSKTARAVERARNAADRDARVLLTGETGTGRETLARCIHFASPRARGPFEVVDCAALPPGRTEAELFSRLERADSGTLLVKEVGLLKAELKARMLRAVKEKAFPRAGTSRLTMADVRLIGTSSASAKARTAGGFESTAYSIALPALRQRRNEIARLAELFLSRAKQGLLITPETIDRLRDYDWPGNLDELRNMMERAAMIRDRVVTVDDLPALGYREEIRGPVTMAEIERRAIEDAVGAHGGNRTHAAAQLGISLRTIQYKIKQYGLEERSRKF